MVSPSGMIGFFGAASYHACHCEEAKPTWQSVLLTARSCGYCLHGVRIATGLTALAMTGVVDGLRLGFDFLCHCCPVFAAVLGNSTKKHTKKRSAVLLSSAFCIIL